MAKDNKKKVKFSSCYTREARHSIEKLYLHEKERQQRDEAKRQVIKKQIADLRMKANQNFKGI